MYLCGRYMFHSARIVLKSLGLSIKTTTWRNAYVCVCEGISKIRSARSVNKCVVVIVDDVIGPPPAFTLRPLPQSISPLLRLYITQRTSIYLILERWRTLAIKLMTKKNRCVSLCISCGQHSLGSVLGQLVPLTQKYLYRQRLWRLLSKECLTGCGYKKCLVFFSRWFKPDFCFVIVIVIVKIHCKYDER